MLRELVVRGGIGHQVGTEELQQSAVASLLFSHRCIYPVEQDDKFGQNKSNGDVINSRSTCSSAGKRPCFFWRGKHQMPVINVFEVYGLMFLHVRTGPI